MKRVFIVALLLLLASIAYSQAVPVAVNVGRPLSVCEVLKDASQYNGKVLEIRGEWDGDLLGSCPVTRTGYYEWPNTIVVELPTSGIVQLEKPATWRVAFDMSVYNQSIRNAWTEWERLPTNERESTSVFATITGRFDSRKALTENNLPFGYGEQNLYPAQLVITNYKDIALARVKQRQARRGLEGR